MRYKSFDDLPGYLKRYLEKFGWPRRELESWLNDPIPALGNRSILQALTDGAQKEVNNVVLYVGDALGIEDPLGL